MNGGFGSGVSVPFLLKIETLRLAIAWLDSAMGAKPVYSPSIKAYCWLAMTAKWHKVLAFVGMRSGLSMVHDLKQDASYCA